MKRGQIKLIRPIIALFLTMMESSSFAQEALTPFTHESTVGDFAMECQHPVKKSHSTERVALCISYINSAVQQVALAKKSPACWNEIEAGATAPGPLMDILYFIASQPDGRSKPLSNELRTVIVEVAAKSCH